MNEQRYAIIEPWSWGIEVEYVSTLEDAIKIRNGACDGSVIYQEVEMEPEYITITENMSTKDRMKVQPSLGRITPLDIGKRVYFKNGYPQVENQAQFKRRTQ